MSQNTPIAPATPVEPASISELELATRFNCSQRTLLNRRKSGRAPRFFYAKGKPGRYPWSVRYLLSDVEFFEANQPKA